MNLGLGLGLPFSRVAGASFVGPLDDYTTSLSLALLPFRGFSSYNGALWRVRDTNDDSEQDVAFDADGQPVFPTLVGNGGIRYWYDQSGNDRHLGQAMSSLQPYLTNNVLNGYPVARCDGTDDELSATWTATEAARTIYIIARKRSAPTSASYDPIFKIAGSSAAAVSCNVGSGYYYNANEAFGAADLGGTSQNWTLVTVKFTDASTAQAWMNNTGSSTFDPRIEYQSGGLTLAGQVNDWADVDIAASILYDAAHDDTTRQAIQTILADKFNITLA